ncbi:MAG: cupin domain-containing protein [Phycisphaerae bacterium]|nr:cupin domain-containing protein [Phycisphaerae bacterium]
MGRYDSVELVGSARDEALAGCRACMDGWHIRMPDVTPLVLHFGIGEFAKIGLIEYWIANETERGYCGKFLFLFEGQRCPCHKHAMKHETFYVLKGRIEMRVEDEPTIMGPGDLLVMPPGKRHTFIALEPALIIEASQPSILRDNFFDDRRIGEEGVI